MLPVLTAFMISNSFVISVPPWNSMARLPLARSLNSLVIHSNATAADSGGGTMCAHRSFLGAACAKTGARPVARMPARPAPVCNMLRRGSGAVDLLIVLRFPPHLHFLFSGLPTAHRGRVPVADMDGTYGAGRLPWGNARNLSAMHGSLATERQMVLLERDDFSSNRHPALAFWWSMIFFRKPVPTFRD